MWCGVVWCGAAAVNGREGKGIREEKVAHRRKRGHFVIVFFFSIWVVWVVFCKGRREQCLQCGVP